MSNDPIAESLEDQDRFYRENPPIVCREDHDCDTHDDGACSICLFDADEAMDRLEEWKARQRIERAWFGRKP